MSRERPILFNGAMVRAILSGEKTQTRRAVRGIALDWLGKAQFTPEYVASPGNDLCPFGQPGDRMWVRESFLPDPDCDHDAWSGHTYTYVSWRGCGSRLNGVPLGLRKPEHCIYRADWDGPELVWRPSIHMPRWACRLVLEITDVRVERLQAMPEADWEAEGISFCMEDPSTAAGHAFNEAEHYAIAGVSMRGTPEDHGMRAQFAEQGLDWDSNPWVWVIEFKQVTP